jgi:multidrug resistance efflux pump
MLTVLLITTVFFFHPSTSNAISLFRTVPILPEANGRVSEIFVESSGSAEVKKGQPLFKLDSSLQQAAVELAQRRVAEVDAERVMAEAEIAAAAGKIQQAQNALKQFEDELRTKVELRTRSAGTVTSREIERLETAVEGGKGEVAAAEANRRAAETRYSTLIPAKRASAEAQLKEVEVQLAKRVIYAGMDGRVEQFILRVGDMVNPMMRPAGVLIPGRDGQRNLQASFGQIEAGVLKVGMAAEAACVSAPLRVIPMVVVLIQDYIAAGQVRASEQLIDVQPTAKSGTILVVLKPLFEGGLNGVLPTRTIMTGWPMKIWDR